MRGGWYIQPPFFIYLCVMGRVVGNDLDNYIYDLTRKVNGIGRSIDVIVKGLAGNYVLKPLKLRLWTKGIDGDGKPLLEYTKGYKRKKQLLGIKTNPTTLRLKGDFYKSMFVSSRNGQVVVLLDSGAKGEPKKSTELLEKYGEAILELTVEEQEVLAEKIVEKLLIDFNKIEFPTIKFT